MAVGARRHGAFPLTLTVNLLGGAAKQQPCLELVWETTEAQVLPAWRGWGEGQGPVGGAEPDDSPGAPGVGVGSM